MLTQDICLLNQRTRSLQETVMGRIGFSPFWIYRVKVFSSSLELGLIRGLFQQCLPAAEVVSSKAV